MKGSTSVRGGVSSPVLSRSGGYAMLVSRRLRVPLNVTLTRCITLIALALIFGILGPNARAQNPDSRLFVVDWRELGAALAPDAPADKRAWALGYVAGILDGLGCLRNRAVDPAPFLKKDQSEVEAVARVTYQIFLEQEKMLEQNPPQGLIGGTAFVRGATVRLWKCDLERSQ